MSHFSAVVINHIPWEMIAPHENQADRNHGQTLQRLAERGGLDAAEAVAVLEDVDYRKRWPRPPISAEEMRALFTEATKRLMELVEAFKNRPAVESKSVICPSCSHSFKVRCD